MRIRLHRTIQLTAALAAGFSLFLTTIEPSAAVKPDGGGPTKSSVTRGAKKGTATTSTTSTTTTSTTVLPEPDSSATVTWGLVGTDPNASSQPTEKGRALTELFTADGKVLAGYGDYDANTGPITVSSVSSAGFTPEHTFDSEAIYNFREVAGRVIVPSIDPRVAADFSVGVPWSDSSALGAAHVFDVATLTGSDLWMVGSQGYDAVAWQSLDGGASWVERQRVAAQAAGDAARFYFAATLNGRLYIQAFDQQTGAHPNALMFDGSGWSTVGPVVQGWYKGWKPITFEGQVVFHGSGHGHWGAIFSFDGAASKIIGYGYDVEAAEGRLFLLDEAQTIRWTDDLVTWQELAGAPADAVSVTANDGNVYVGTRSSQIWVAPIR